MATVVLLSDGFRNVDPSHPLGGRDGLKDMILTNNGAKWIGAVYFPRGQKSFSDIKSKFEHDLEGVKQNKANGIVFITNQELRLSERKELTEIDDDIIDVQIYHLERLATLLNSPENYGVRMEFLEIEMNKEEQLAFFANQNQKISNIEATLEKLTIGLEEYKLSKRLPEVKQDEELFEREEEFYEDEPRSIDEIVDAVGVFLDKIWFDRHLSLRYRIETGMEAVNPEIWKGALNSA